MFQMRRTQVRRELASFFVSIRAYGILTCRIWAWVSVILRLAAASSLVSVSAASNDSKAHKASITFDGKAVPLHRCSINSSSRRNLSPTNKRVRLNYKLHSSSTTMHIDVGLFNECGFHLVDEEMPDKADLPAVLRVLDVMLRRLSYDERLPLALGKLLRKCVAGQGDDVSSPAEDEDGAQKSTAEVCTSRLSELTIALQRAPRSSVRCPYY